MQCPRCEFMNQADSRFCTECGQRLGREPAPASLVPDSSTGSTAQAHPPGDIPVLRKNKAGLAAFLLGIAGIVLWVLTIFGFLWALGSALSGASSMNSDLLGIGIVGCFFLAVVVNLTGLVLGIVATTKEDLRKGFAIAGTCLNAIPPAFFLLAILPKMFFAMY